MTLPGLRSKVDALKGQQQQILKQQEGLEREVVALEKKQLDIAEARELLRVVALKTQEQLRYHISEVVSLAMDAIFDDPYTLEVDFVPKRGKTECELWFSRNDERVVPMTASGGGAIDVAAFALRVALFTLSIPKRRNVLILDEPFKHLKGVEANKRAIQMVKEISKKLNIQIITISDERIPFEEIEKGADRIFKITKAKGRTEVKVL